MNVSPPDSQQTELAEVVTAGTPHLPVLLPDPDISLVAVRGAAVLHTARLGEDGTAVAGRAPGAGLLLAGGGGLPGRTAGGGPGGCGWQGSSTGDGQ